MDNKQNITNETDFGGNLKISDDVIATLSAKAAKEVDGVVGMASGIVGNITATVLGKKDSARGIDVDVKDGAATITLHVKVRYGVKIPEVAWKVQENVKTIVESVTGIPVDKVNISVESIEFITEDTEPAEVVESDTEPEILDVDVVDEN